MATSTNSRISGNFVSLRDRKGLSTNPQSNTAISQQQGLKLSLPEENTYEPTNSFSNSRTQMRMLKGKVDRTGASIDREKGGSAINFQEHSSTNNAFTKAPLSSTQMNHTFKPKPESETTSDFKLSRPPLPQSGLKLILPDEFPVAGEKEKRNTGMAFNEVNKEVAVPGRRILIAPEEKRGESRERKIMIQQVAEKREEPVVVPVQQQQNRHPPQQQQEVAKHPPPPPKPVEPPQPPQEFIQNDNELIECPEGCGRKFNKKALETHAKACKIVFMSKRKEFNAQAKRIADKDQAKLIKQAKMKQKKEKQGNKMQKTSEAWKTQSEGFRAVVKALKQEDVQVGEEDVKAVKCDYCEKFFNEVLLAKHLLICEVKKDKEKKLVKKGSKKA